MRRAAVAHFVANLLLLGLGYYWLGTGESKTSALAWSILVALLFVSLTAWTYSAALVYFRSARGPVLPAWRQAVRNLLPFLLAVFAVAAVYLLLASWADYTSTPTLRIASYLTLKFRKPVKPSSVLRVFTAITWLVRWVILPVLLLPMLSAIAGRGWSGWREFGAMIRNKLFWIAAPVLLLATLWIPWKLLTWTPHMNSFAMEMTSFAARSLVAYLLFVVAWLALAFVTSGGRPRWIHPRTVASP